MIFYEVIVDTMTPWDTKFILLALEANGLTPDDINYVVSTHGHSDHIGNNNLFLKAKHIVGYCVSVKDQYFLHPFDKGKRYVFHMNWCVVLLSI
jgi:glyoxylase-like metal-dependent hydrolase (beta-lactamase superfamily II)